MAREVIYTPKAPKPGAPYAQAIKANGFLFVTGQVSRIEPRYRSNWNDKSHQAFPLTARLEWNC